MNEVSSSSAVEPAFPDDIATAPLLRIELSKLQQHDAKEEKRLWDACCGLGFFYLDLRSSSINDSEHAQNVDDIDGEGLLEDAKVGEELFDLPLAEKQKYDYASRGSYFGYKGYGGGLIDQSGTRDRNEFYNVSRDDILGLTAPIPAPALLQSQRPLLSSFMRSSHAVVSLILRVLNDHLRLPPGTLQNMHRLTAAAGDQVRWVKAPPQPVTDRQAALGAHSDFGSVTVLFNRLGGLQVQMPETAEGTGGEWLYVRPLPGHAIINLGDAMVKFTSGLLRSNIHRVMPPPGAQAEHTRYSLVYFARPEDEVFLRRLEGSDLIDAKARKSETTSNGHMEEPIRSKDWILKRALGSRNVETYGESRGTEEMSRRR